MGKVVVLVETAVLSVSDQSRKATPQFRTFHVLELEHKIDPAVPDFQRRKLHERDKVFAIGGHGA